MAGTTSSTAPSIAAQLLTIVQSTAELNGGFAPADVRYVATDRQSAVSLDYPITVDSDQPVYLVEFDGPVVADMASIPAGASTPTGHAMYLVIDRATMRVTDWGVIEAGNPDINLSLLGTVTSIPTS